MYKYWSIYPTFSTLKLAEKSVQTIPARGNDSDKSEIENFEAIDKNVQNVHTRVNDSHKSDIEKYAE